VVAPAKRSPAAAAKIRTGKTSDGFPVHSFQSLMADLGTLVKNRIHLKKTGKTFDLYTTPTPVQKQAYEFLGAPLRL
jgi:hypothetical protein